MKINIHAGHNPDGKVACGAIGLMKESTEARELKDKIIKLLRDDGHTVYDCTVDNGTSASDVLKKIIAKCNKNTVDKDVSVHFNSGVNKKTADKKTTGVEVLVYNKESKMYDEAKEVCARLEEIGFKNRGVKVRTNLAYLKGVKTGAMLVETCFVDDADDVKLYQENVDKIALAIAESIVDKKITVKKDVTSTNTTANKTNTTTTTTTSTKKKSDAKIKKDNIKKYQKWLNTNFKAGLTVDGIWGTNTKKASIKAWQKTMNSVHKTKLVVDGIFGANSYSVASNATLKKGYENKFVYILQGLLNAKGYICDIDGTYGSDTKNKVIAFQKDKKLTADGVVGKKSWNKLFA